MKKTKVLYISNSFSSPDKVNVGSVTRNYYHVVQLAEKVGSVSVVASPGSTVSDQNAENISGLADNICFLSVDMETVKGKSVLARASYHLRFFLKGLFRALGAGKFDINVASMASIPIGYQAFLVKLLKGGKLLLDVRDMWTESLTSTSLAKVPGFIVLNHILENFLYRRADHITCTSMPQVASVREIVRDKVPVSYVPNGIDPELRQNDNIQCEFMENIRRQFKKIVLFAGKHSNYTAPEKVLPAAEKLAGEGIAFCFIGGGYAKKPLIEKASEMNLKNVFFHDQVPKAELACFLSAADIFLINYSKSDAWKKVLPNKMFDYLYWNKPIVASVVDGEITRIMKESGAGASVPPEDPEALANAVRNLLNVGKENPDTRKYVLEHFDRTKTSEKFVNACLSILKK